MAEQEEDVNFSDEEHSHSVQEIEEDSTRLKLQVITDLKNNPGVWDSRLAEYTNKVKRQETLDAIANKSNKTIEDIKKLIHSLRTSMTREVKRMVKDCTYKSKWPFYSSMAFMIDEILRSLQDKEVPKWTDSENDTLINFFKEHPLLWDHKNKEYKDRCKRSAILEKLVELLERKKSVEDCRKQWHSLKVIFNKNLIRHEGSKKSGADTDSVFIPTWKFYESMMFTRATDVLDSSSSTLDESMKESDEQSGESEIEPSTKKGRRCGKADSDPAEMEKAKIEMYHAAIAALKQPCQTAPTNDTGQDELQAFGKSVAETLRRFQPRQIAIAKKRISDVLFDVDMEAEIIPNNNPSFNMSTYRQDTRRIVPPAQRQSYNPSRTANSHQVRAGPI